jgi:hypothetical protein
MAIIQSGATADTLTIDPSSNAARATLYDSSGNELIREPAGGIYHLPIGLRLTTAIAAGGLVWAMRNGGTRTIYVTEIELLFGFDGTAAVSTSRWELIRFSGANPATGTTLTPVKHASSMPASTVQDARFNEAAALTVTGITFEGQAMAYGGCQRQLHANNNLHLRADALMRRGIFELAANEGLALRTNLAAVIGDSCLGHVAWEEQ